MSEKRKYRTWKFYVNTEKDMRWNKVLLTKKWSRDPLTNYELHFLSDYASIAKFKSQKMWRLSADVCGDGEGKSGGGGFHPPLLAEIG